MSAIPPAYPGQTGLKPHRATVVLVLGILGLVVCFICGIIAWVMGNGDIREMDAGRMDPSGRGMTQAGRIIGIIGTVLGSIALIWVIISFGIAAVAVGGAAAAGSHP